MPDVMFGAVLAMLAKTMTSVPLGALLSMLKFRRS